MCFLHCTFIEIYILSELHRFQLSRRKEILFLELICLHGPHFHVFCTNFYTLISGNLSFITLNAF